MSGGNEHAGHSGSGGLLSTIQEYSLPLIFGVIAAVIWANIDMDSYQALLHWLPASLEHTLHHGLFKFLVDDLFMALFFGIAAKEITESCLPGGALSSPAKAANPLMGTLGGVIGPVGVFLAYAHFFDAPEISNGWGVPTATDIALAWLVARLAFGRGHPAVSFLLLLAVADDAIGLGIIAIFYSGGETAPAPLLLLLVAAGMVVSLGLRKRGVTSFWPYLLLGGTLSWCGLYFAHLHPALALVPIVPFMPSKGYDEGLYAEADQPAENYAKTDTLDQFEHFFKSTVDFGLFFFGLANAGVGFSAVGHATWAVLGALVVGKVVGIFGFSFIAHKVGLSLPEGMNVRALLVAGLTAALGLTVALFVAGVAYPASAVGGDVGLAANLTGAAKMGALLSAFVAPAVLIVARLMRIEKVEG